VAKVKKAVHAKETNSSRKATAAEPVRAAKAVADEPVSLDRRGGDRRRAGERRQQSAPVAIERRKTPRRKVPRRRQIDPTTCERDYSGEELEFMSAMDAYKRSSGRMFPTCSEVLEVLRSLGYEKRVPTVEPAPMPAPETAMVVEPVADLPHAAC
jgi:hypothetical protein